MFETQKVARSQGWVVKVEGRVRQVQITLGHSQCLDFIPLAQVFQAAR